MLELIEYIVCELQTSSVFEKYLVSVLSDWEELKDGIISRAAKHSTSAMGFTYGEDTDEGGSYGRFKK